MGDLLIDRTGTVEEWLGGELGIALRNLFNSEAGIVGDEAIGRGYRGRVIALERQIDDFALSNGAILIAFADGVAAEQSGIIVVVTAEHAPKAIDNKGCCCKEQDHIEIETLIHTTGFIYERKGLNGTKWQQPLRAKFTSIMQKNNNGKQEHRDLSVYPETLA